MEQNLKEKLALVQKWCEFPIELRDISENEISSDYVESGASITGSNSARAYDENEELKNAATTGNPVEAFKKAPLNGCISVMTMARVKAKFDPTIIDDKEGQKKFNAYSSNLQSAPFFHLKSSEVTHISHSEKDWKKTIDSIVSLFTGISEGDKNAIAKSIANLAAAASSKVKEEQTKNLFIQSTINYSDEIEVLIYWSHITMKYDNGKPTSFDTNVDVSQLKFIFDKQMWPYYAETVLKYNMTFIEDWLKANALPPNKNINKICFYNKNEE